MRRVSVAWLRERFKGNDLDLVYDVSSRMVADIYTKAFTDLDKVWPGLHLRPEGATTKGVLD